MALRQSIVIGVNVLEVRGSWVACAPQAHIASGEQDVTTIRRVNAVALMPLKPRHAAGHDADQQCAQCCLAVSVCFLLLRLLARLRNTPAVRDLPFTCGKSLPLPPLRYM
jgi:hypothetical protein